MAIPDTLWPALGFVGGFVFFCVGVSFGWKFVQAAMSGRLTYWSGLEKFGILFIPITWIISPLIIHLPYNPKNSLIKETQQLWVHIIWAPVFFVFALMFMTSGADLMGLPGSTSLNTVLTLNRGDVPPCIVYSPPFSYRFPFVKKAARTILRALSVKIPEERKNKYNAYDQKGEDTSQYSKFAGSEFFYDEDDDKPTPQQMEDAARIQEQQQRSRGKK